LRVRGKSPLRLVLQRAIGRRGLALKVESRIKRLPRCRKEELVGRADRVRAVVAMVRREARRGS
jgi:predicted GIY-YIG superfamily endonuclease